MASDLRSQILDLVKTFSRQEHASAEFVAGVTPVLVSGRVFDAVDVQTLVDASLDFWLTTGRYNEQFEKKFSQMAGLRHVLTCNSGSSANLIAFSSFFSKEFKKKAVQPGDEVVTVASAFPTTVNPILFYGCVPVFVDIVLPHYNVDPVQLEQAITRKTRAIVLAHTLGNPFDVERIMNIAQKHHLWVLEDCCDALGSTYGQRHVGTFGDAATFSFYPAHHITMGEGGAVGSADARLNKVMESIRDWGRDCWCAPGKANTCGKRFSWELGQLPKGYDHKYIYSHLGFNLKITDMQAAVGVAQLDHLPDFIQKRKDNFRFLKEVLSGLKEYFILPEPMKNSDPSWFGFPISVRKEAPFKREDLTVYLHSNKVETRLLFSGNITRQPYMIGRKFRQVSQLSNSDFVMQNTFWLGVYPGLTRPMLHYVVDQIQSFVKRYS